MRRERPDHTLQPAILIHEVYLRLVRQNEVTWKDRAHFFGIAARLMRQILVDYARKHSSQKRGGMAAHVTSGDLAIDAGNLADLLGLDEALDRMRGWNQRKLEIVELHYFGGMKAEEISEALGLTLATLRRDLDPGKGLAAGAVQYVSFFTQYGLDSGGVDASMESRNWTS